MLRILLVGVVLGGLTACDQPTSTTSEVAEDAGSGFIVEGPTEAVEFACADGRQVMVRAFMGGVIVSVDGQSYQMPQISVPDGDRGYYHQLGDLGWFEDEDGNGHLIAIGPGVFCERIGPMWWELDDSAD
jgi:hypothetical protein